MPNASAKVGGEIRRGTRLRERRGKGEDIKICFVFRSDGRIPTAPDCWASSTLGVVPNSFWDRPGTFRGEPRFCFLHCRRVVPSHSLPLHISLRARLCVCVCARACNYLHTCAREESKIQVHYVHFVDSRGSKRDIGRTRCKPLWASVSWIWMKLVEQLKLRNAHFFFWAEIHKCRGWNYPRKVVSPLCYLGVNYWRYTKELLRSPLCKNAPVYPSTCNYFLFFFMSGQERERSMGTEGLNGHRHYAEVILRK